MENNTNPENKREIQNDRRNVAPLRSNWIWIIAVVVVVLIAALTYAYRSPKTEQSQNGTVLSPAQSESTQADQAATVAKDPAEETKVFSISAKSFEFSLKEIKVKRGEKVRIDLTVTQGMHAWKVDEFNAQTKQINAGQSDSVTFTADKAGTFEYYCSVANHRQMGMVGKLIVE